MIFFQGFLTYLDIEEPIEIFEKKVIFQVFDFQTYVECCINNEILFIDRELKSHEN